MGTISQPTRQQPQRFELFYAVIDEVVHIVLSTQQAKPFLPEYLTTNGTA